MSSVFTEHFHIFNLAYHIAPPLTGSLRPGFIEESPSEFIVNSVSWAPPQTSGIRDP